VNPLFLFAASIHDAHIQVDFFSIFSVTVIAVDNNFGHTIIILAFNFSKLAKIPMYIKRKVEYQIQIGIIL
jgi:hypothetical protein